VHIDATKRHAPAPAAPAKALRDYVRDELLRDGWKPCPTGHPYRLARGWDGVVLHDTHALHAPSPTSRVSSYPYRPAHPSDARAVARVFGTAITRAVAAFDAAGGAR
jgi:hypothetical protein